MEIANAIVRAKSFNSFHISSVNLVNDMSGYNQATMGHLLHDI